MQLQFGIESQQPQRICMTKRSCWNLSKLDRQKRINSPCVPEAGPGWVLGSQSTSTLNTKIKQTHRSTKQQPWGHQSDQLLDRPLGQFDLNSTQLNQNDSIPEEEGQEESKHSLLELSISLFLFRAQDSSVVLTVSRSVFLCLPFVFSLSLSPSLCLSVSLSLQCRPRSPTPAFQT